MGEVDVSHLLSHYENFIACHCKRFKWIYRLRREREREHAHTCTRSECPRMNAVAVDSNVLPVAHDFWVKFEAWTQKYICHSGFFCRFSSIIITSIWNSMWKRTLLLYPISFDKFTHFSILQRKNIFTDSWTLNTAFYCGMLNIFQIDVPFHWKFNVYFFHIIYPYNRLKVHFTTPINSIIILWWLNFHLNESNRCNRKHQTRHTHKHTFVTLVAQHTSILFTQVQ